MPSGTMPMAGVGYQEKNTMGNHPDPDPDYTAELAAWWRFWDYILSEE